jgi:hypothetical protein
MPVRLRWALILLCLWMGAGPMGAQALREYQAKGAFLVNFAKFIEWPDEVFDGPTGPVDVCVVAESWIYEELETTLKHKLVGKRPVRLHPRGDTARCHLLFVGGHQRPEPIFESLNDHTVRVGEQPQFLSSGGHISFHLHGDRIHFDIANGVTHQKKFRVSSRLLALVHKEE